MLSRILLTSVVLSALCAAAATPRPAKFTAVIHKATFEKDGTFPIRFEAKQSHPLLATGPRDSMNDPLEHTSVHLTERPRLHPDLIVTATSGKIVRAILNYGEEAFSIPPGRLVFRARHQDSVLGTIELGSLSGVVRKAVDFTWPESMETVSAMHPEMLVELTIDHQEVSTFAYTLEEGIPSDVYHSEQMYDLLPHNSTMMTKFMIKVHSQAAVPKMSVWISRKSVSPDFTLIVAIDGVIFSQANIEHDPQSTDALGYDVEIKNHVADLLKKRIDFVVHFYERPRSQRAVAKIDNLRETIQRLQGAGKPMASETLPTDQPNLNVQLQYHTETNFVGLRVLQPGPIADVQLSLYREVATDDEDGRVLFLREGDDVVPYFDPKSELQYGWDDALPANVDAVSVDGEDLFASAVLIEIVYNPSTDASIASDLRRWIVHNGGKVGDLDLSYLDEEQHSFEERHALVSKSNIDRGDVIASIPYGLLVTSGAVERGTWSKILSNRSAVHAKHVEDEGVHGDAAKIMHLTTVVHLQLFDESMNLRPYFNTFTKSGNKLPPLFDQDEVKLFDFDPQVRKEMDRMTALWNVEYETLQESAVMLPRGFTRDSYFAARSQVETRLLNLTGELVLAPIVDLLTHDDSPNAKIEYNDESHVISILAGEDIPKGTPITIDFGAKDKTGLDFLIQFGFVPPRAIDAATVDVPDLGASYLTRDMSSRTALESRLREHRQPSNGDDKDSDEDPAIVGDVMKAIRERFAALSAAATPHHPKSNRIESYATNLLNVERSVLQLHQQAAE